jgi:ribonuclease BN (tRNA processing enzyme)
MKKFQIIIFSILFCFTALFFGALPVDAADLGVTIRFLGTDAADPGGWTTYGRQLSSILVGNNLLVDFSCWTNNANSGTGTCGLARLYQYGIDLNAINLILITHHHQDHFDPAQIVALAQARTSATKLTLYGGIAVVNGMNSYLSGVGKTGLINVVHLGSYVQAAVGPYAVTPLIANHDTPGNEPYVYMIQYNGKQFFYGTDSGIINGTSLAMIYATKFDLVIRERTFSASSASADAAHMDTNKVAVERADWITHGVIAAATPYALTHIAFCKVGNCLIPAGAVDPGDGAYFPENYSPVGAFDYADCNSFSGWACDANDYANPIAVHFYADGKIGSGVFIGSVTANSVREAAVGNQCGGNNEHGFYLATPNSLKDGKSHAIYAYPANIPAGGSPLLAKSPKTIQCGKNICSNECDSLGAKLCEGAANYKTCGNYDADSCREWSVAVACPSGETCSAAGNCSVVCVPTCANAGDRQCSGNGVQTCSLSGGCLKWSAQAGCVSGKTCVDGACVVTANCNPGEVSGCRVCRSDGKLWVDIPSKCGADESCIDGVCMTRMCRPGTFDGCGICNDRGDVWMPQASRCAASQVCSFGYCVDFATFKAGRLR